MSFCFVHEPLLIKHETARVSYPSLVLAGKKWPVFDPLRKPMYYNILLLNMLVDQFDFCISQMSAAVLQAH